MPLQHIPNCGMKKGLFYPISSHLTLLEFINLYFDITAVQKYKMNMASELALKLVRPRRTRCSRNTAEMTGDGEDDGEQHPQEGGAKAQPQDRPPGLERRRRCAEWRHGTAAVAGPETNAIRGGLHSTGVGTLEKRRKK